MRKYHITEAVFEELNERQSRALKYAFRKGFIKNSVYAEINEVSSKTASND